MKSLFFWLLVMLMIVLGGYEATAGTGAIPKGPDVLILKPNLLFKGGDTKIMTNDVDDPSVVAKDAELGSAYIEDDTGYWFRKGDNGSSTNWINFLFASLGTDECVPRWDGTAVPLLQDSLFCITDLGYGTGLTGLDVDNITIDGNSITSTDVNGPINLTPNGAGEVVASTLEVTDLTDSRAIIADGANGLVTNNIEINPSDEILGVTRLRVDNLQLDGNGINSIDANGNITLTPNGSGEVIASTLTVSDLTAFRMVYEGGAGLQTNGITTNNSDELSAITRLTVDNLELNGNTLQSLDVDGNIVLDPNGTGNVNLPDLTVSQPAYIDASGNLVSQDISLTTDVTGVLPIANGGTNSSNILNNNRHMISSGGAIVEHSALSAGSIFFGDSNGLLDESANLTWNNALNIMDVVGQFNIDNITIDGNTISSSNVDGNIVLDPNGTGSVNLPDLTASQYVVTDASSNLTTVAGLSSSDLTSSTVQDGELLIGVDATDSFVEASLTGTANQVNVSNGAGSITLSTPQDIATGSSPTFAGATISGLTANRAIITDGSSALSSSSVTDTELGYVSGVTSAIQTQLDAKIDDFSSTTDNAIVRTDGTSGNAVQDSGVIISDADAITGVTQLTVDNLDIDGNTISSISGGISLDSFTGPVSVLDQLSISSSLLYNGSTTFLSNTADADDTGQFSLTGGGDLGSTRGSYLILSGNENGTYAGNVKIGAGEAGIIDLTGNTQITGGLDVVSTTAASEPCPTMTNTQRNDLEADTGDCVYSFTDSEYQYYNGSAWSSMGGGAGGSRLNLLDDSSFEKVVANGTCTGCTASQDTTDYLATPNNEASLKMAFSAASGNYTWTESTSAQYSNVAGTVSAWIKTSASDCHFVSMVDGAESQTVAISSDDEWKEYIINETIGTTSFGYRVECNTSITDDVYVDETFAGAATPDTFDIGTANLWGSVKWDTTTNCQWSNSTTAAWNNFGADVDCDDNARTIRGTYNSTGGDAADSDGQLPKIVFSYIPAGVLRCSATGLFQGDTSANLSSFRFSDGTNTTTTNPVFGTGGSEGSVIIAGEFNYTAPQTSTTTIQIQSNPEAGSSNIFANSSPRELEISCYHYPSPQKVVAAKCDGLECINEFSAKITHSSGSTVVDSENVDWISSCSTADEPVCTFTSGIFGSVAPSCVLVPQGGSTTKYSSGIKALSASSITLQAAQNSFTTFSGSATYTSYHLHCQRQGSDYKQFDQRMVKVIQEEDGDNWTSFTPTSNWVSNTTHYGKWRKNGDSMDISYSLALTGAPTAVQLAVDMPSGYSIDTTKLPQSGTFGSVQGVATVYDNSTAVYTCSVSQNGSDAFLVYCGDAAGDKTVSNVQPITFASGDNVNMIITVPIQGWKKDVNAFIGNLTPKEFVQTPGSTKPVMYSAYPQTTGTVINEVGSFINGNCTNASPQVCTFEAGIFSQEPACWVQAMHESYFCGVTALGTGSISYKCKDFNGTDSTTSVNKKIICHGVQ